MHRSGPPTRDPSVLTPTGGTACSCLPRLAVIFPGSCSFPSEASPSSSVLVRSQRHRPPVLSTWSTTERNKEMTVHGEDDSRDPAACSNFVFSGRRRVSTGLCGTRGPSSPGFYFICLAHDQPSLFFSFLKMASPAILFFCRITNIGLLAFLRPAGPKIFQDKEGCIRACPENGL